MTLWGVLHGQQAGPVARQLTLSGPLEECHEDRSRGESDDGEPHAGEPDQDFRHRPVEHMITHDVAQLVAYDVGELVVVQKLHGARVQDDERLVHAVGPGVYDGRLGNEERVFFGCVERPENVLIETRNAWELPLRDPYGACEERQANRFLTEKAEELTEHVVEHRNLSERRECDPVCRVLPGTWRDVRQDACGSHILFVLAVSVVLVVLSHGCPSPYDACGKGEKPSALSSFTPPLGGEVSGPGPLATRFQASAWSKSWIKSSTSSMPTESRTSPSVIPNASRISLGTDAWVWSARYADERLNTAQTLRKLEHPSIGGQGSGSCRVAEVH